MVLVSGNFSGGLGDADARKRDLKEPAVVYEVSWQMATEFPESNRVTHDNKHFWTNRRYLAGRTGQTLCPAEKAYENFSARPPSDQVRFALTPLRSRV